MKSVRKVKVALLLAAGALLPAAAVASDAAPAAHAPAADAQAMRPLPARIKPVRVDKAEKAEPPGADVSGKVANAPPAAAVDPLEHLRQRLAERMAGGRPTEPGTAGEMLLTSRSTLTPAPAARPAAPSRAPRTAVVAGSAHAAPAAAKATKPARAANPSDGHAADAPAHWAYQGAAGPQTWGGLRPEFALCGTGQRQSPIDIRDGLPVDLEPVKFDYQQTRFGVIDNGHTVQANVAPGSAIEVGGKRFQLVQFHFHRPSEERIDGRQFEMSVHLVHKDEQGRLAVVAVLLDKGPPQPAVQKVWNNLPLERHEEVSARVTLDLEELLPADRRYYTYMGSLTTPPCSEGVQWVVMRQPVSVSPEQVDLFSRIYPMNARPLQQASGRRILQSN